MKNILTILVLLMAFSSCIQKTSKSSPLFFYSSENFKYNHILIAGSDTQKVDSIYNDRFNNHYDLPYPIDDSFMQLYARLSIIRKCYISKELETLLHRFLEQNNISNINCDSNRFNYNGLSYEFDYSDNNKLCYSLNEKINFEDTATILNFYSKLKTKAEKEIKLNESEIKFFVYLKYIVYSYGFPPSTEENKLLLQVYIQRFLDDKQKRELNDFFKIDNIYFKEEFKNDDEFYFYH